ncbi:MAG: phosphoribosylformylglycinamidine cyclo-ligase [Pyrobaculum arsenaticum]|uniref:phosphoribosylformylglycinamidine cyclo-ligase n=2 Tax=Pyrobaculum arsenaticum TaxID=121277 RepID=A4WMX0_PYRAR|nr:phosphoribosylformylglycinamidine cyclo-ligase [Pyrobaculum arsenaticum]ABP51737.1 phosphoribosylformylglycinamidine cyclo-ligase [Pyrobaculum arsenaticum DSM 13514]MCY0890069.1 phosphoribosylformylglycinamidine cyclo-ligase [Pyrobaculum arsenaticum]NYR16056.1 phosphoribosylformylglycinamidine cyclo-ligase [Pyrobaculum arsenaticum]
MRYKDAGVDLDKQKTIHAVARRLLSGGEGAYVRWIEIGSHDLALHVDGVGTKTVWLLQAGKIEVAGWDCLAVNINDVVCDGFKAVAVVDYIAVSPGLEDAAARVLKGLERASAEADVVILGGETAIMPDVVNGIDVVCTVLAVREAIPRPPSIGDYVVGVESSGPHANGYSLLRRLFRLDEEICGVPVAESLLQPVVMYHKILPLFQEGLIKAAAHITGGGFTKLKRALGNLGAELELGQLPCWARAVLKKGVPKDEAYRVFNMGIGIALVTDKPADLVRRLEDLGYSARVIGRVKPEGSIAVDGVRVS